MNRMTLGAKVLTLAVVIMALGGCATSEEIKLRMRVAELEQIVAGKDDDLGYLMKAVMDQQVYIYQLENGAVWQAREMARIRNTCET